MGQGTIRPSSCKFSLRTGEQRPATRWCKVEIRMREGVPAVGVANSSRVENVQRRRDTLVKLGPETSVDYPG